MRYRKTWEVHNGPIPNDKNGRTFEIHHIDKNRNNNNIENLSCISIDEHFLIHLIDGDYLACYNIARRMDLDKEYLNKLSKLGGEEALRRKLGYHAITGEERKENCSNGGKATKGMVWWTNGIDNTRSLKIPGDKWVKGRSCIDKKMGIKIGTKLGVFWNNGKENKRSDECPGDGWVRGKFLTKEQRQRRVEIAKSKIITEETRTKMSNSRIGKRQEIVECPYCFKSGGIYAMHQWHFNNCKEKENY